MEFQDNDPIRRYLPRHVQPAAHRRRGAAPDCATPFTPNVAGKCAVYSGTEQVCNKDGTLGIVLLINLPPSTSTTSTNPYCVDQPC